MKNIKSFQSFSDFRKEAVIKQVTEEKSALQQEYADFFKDLLKKYDVGSPAELSDEDKSKFFDEVSTGWDKGEGKNAKGEESVEDVEESVEESVEDAEESLEEELDIEITEE